MLNNLIKEYYDALQTLSFGFVSEDIFNKNIDINDVRVMFKVYNNETNVVDYVYKKINDINAKDVTNTYALQTVLNKKSKEELDHAAKTILEVIKYKEEKIMFNNVLVQEFKKVNNSAKFDFVLVDEKDVKRVEDVKEDSKVADKAREIVRDFDGSKFLIITLAVAIAGMGGYAAYLYGKTQANKDTKDNTENIGIEETIEEEVVEETPVEEVIEEPSEEVVDEESATEVYEEEETTVEIDPNSIEAISATVDRIYNEIQSMDNQDLKMELDIDTIEALVRYAHHSEAAVLPNFDDEDLSDDEAYYRAFGLLTNEGAYQLLSKIYNNGYDISNFFENLECHDRLHNLNDKAFNITEEKGKYIDEYETYKALDDCVNNLGENSFAEAVAIRAVADNITVINSMQLARGGALEMKDTPMYWKDVNGDKVITYEENAEGEAYENEKANAEDIANECLAIFNKIDSNNPDNELNRVVYRALDEDERIKLSR